MSGSESGKREREAAREEKRRGEREEKKLPWPMRRKRERRNASILFSLVYQGQERNRCHKKSE